MYQNKCDNSWKKVAHTMLQSHIFGVFLYGLEQCSYAVPPTEAGKIVKQLLHFVMSMSTALTFHHSASSLYSQTQKFMEIDDAADTRKMVTQVGVNFVYYFMRLVAASSIMEFFGFLSFTEKMGTGDIFKIAFSTFVGDEFWKLNKANASAFTSKDYASTMFSKNDATAIQYPSTASEDAVASLISITGISKQLKNITRQTSVNVVGEAQNKLFLASLEGQGGQISSILDIDNPCGQSHIIEAQCAASSTSEEEGEAGVKLKPDI